MSDVIEPWMLIAALSLLVVIAVLQLLILLRRQPDPEAGLRLLAQQMASQASSQRDIGREIGDAARENRQELGDVMRDTAQLLTQQLSQNALAQGGRIDALGNNMATTRDSIEQQFARLRQDNDARLEAIRHTVDEQLHKTLKQRLGDSFKQVADRLDQVQRGLGEMQVLAGDVGDLKRVLTNVKTRGVWGEAQLAAILEQMFSPDQYAVNVEIKPGSGERVEFAIRLPGDKLGTTIWLPIDAKFPREEYERLQKAQEAGDAKGASEAARRLATRLKQEAKTIQSKYLAPPITSDFAILFVPVEGLFAELARRPGLLDQMHRESRILFAGPTTLAAILSSLQMGFRTLAVEQRSSEVRQLLVTVKNEFGQFADVLARTREQLEKAAGSIGHAQTRTRVISRKLSEVEGLPPILDASVAGPGPSATDGAQRD